ncbi:MAG TPA: 3'-5' exonuclease, partial [Allosphingosinicella sp.]
QDTNASQWSIVERLAEEYFSGEGRSSRHRTIFTVGDFKQAIFSFQGTNPAEFEDARRRFSSAALALRENALDLFNSGERLPPDFLDLSMDRSFRSAPEVLRVVDRVIAELGHEALGLPRRPNPHVSHHESRPGSVTLWQPFQPADDVDEEAGEEGWISDNVRLYASCLARQVAAWLRRPFCLEAEKRPLRPEDILILVRRRGDLAALIVARLHAEDVPVAGIDRLSLSAPLAVKDLLAAARFAIQPLEDLNLASLLVSPLLGWSQDDLFDAAFRRDGSLWPRLRERAGRGEGPDLAPLYDMLAMADFATPHDFFELLLSGPLGGRRKLIERLGPEARDPIEELLSSALEFESAGAPSLARFLDWFARGEVEIVRDPSAPLDAVRVMTVHGSKGLEAPVVILADACADPQRLGPAGRFAALQLEEDRKVPVPRPRKNDLAEPLKSSVEEQDRRDREEHWRLLYVAMTRAKERLFVGGALGATAKAPPEASWFRAVEQAMAGLGGVWEEDERWKSAITFGEKGHPPPLHGDVQGRSSAQGNSPPAPAGGAGGGPSSLPSFLTRPAPTEERPPRPLAPSAVAEDEAPYPPPGPEQRRAALRGKLLHRLFERLPAAPPAERRRLADQWLASSGDAPDADFRAELIDDACRVIDHADFADLFSAESLAEAPIAAVVEGGLVVTGTVDRLLVRDDRILVADFKTGRSVPDRPEEAPASHLRQMAAYRAALRIIFPGRTIDAALLYTAGPRIHPLPAELLDLYAPAGA